MRITNWYNNGSRNALRKFCIQCRNKLVSIKLIDDLEPVEGMLYSHRLRPLETAGIFLLLTNIANHLAFYPLYDIESLHHLDSESAIVNTSTILTRSFNFPPISTALENIAYEL